MEQTPQTESSTYILGSDPDMTCFEKAKRNGEKTFSLRSQDITADAYVRAWGMGQIHMKIDMANGFTKEEAAKRLEDRLAVALGLPHGVEADLLANMPKVEQAMVIAHDMQQWPNRKVAD